MYHLKIFTSLFQHFLLPSKGEYSVQYLLTVGHSDTSDLVSATKGVYNII